MQGARGGRGGTSRSSSGLLAKTAQRPPKGAIRHVCASNSHPQHASTLLQHSPQETLLRVPADVRSFWMHPRGRTTGLRVAWGCISGGSNLLEITGGTRTACIAMIAVADASTIIATAPADSSIFSIASFGWTPECRQCPRWLYCRHCPRRLGLECLPCVSVSGVHTHLHLSTVASALAAPSKAHGLSAVLPVSLLSRPSPLPQLPSLSAASPLSTLLELSGQTAKTLLEPLESLAALPCPHCLLWLQCPRSLQCLQCLGPLHCPKRLVFARGLHCPNCLGCRQCPQCLQCRTSYHSLQCLTCRQCLDVLPCLKFLQCPHCLQRLQSPGCSEGLQCQSCLTCPHSERAQC